MRLRLTGILICRLLMPNKYKSNAGTCIHQIGLDQEWDRETLHKSIIIF